jgi:hypothetical protein
MPWQNASLRFVCVYITVSGRLAVRVGHLQYARAPTHPYGRRAARRVRDSDIVIDIV